MLDNVNSSKELSSIISIYTRQIRIVYSCLIRNIDERIHDHSCLQLFFAGRFTSNYKITIGADFAIKALDWDPHTKINLQLWYCQCVYSSGCCSVRSLDTEVRICTARTWKECIRAISRDEYIFFSNKLRLHGINVISCYFTRYKIPITNKITIFENYDR